MTRPTPIPRSAAILIDNGWGEKWGAHYATLVVNASGLEHDVDGMDDARAARLMGITAQILADAGEIAHLGPGGAYDAAELGKIIGVVACAGSLLGSLHHHRAQGASDARS